MKILNELLAFLTASINRKVAGETLQRNFHILLKTGLVCLCFSILFISSANAQIKTLDKVRNKALESKVYKLIKSDEHSAKKAALYSTVIPGWGQAYNKKYWKVPIVWAGVGGIGYFIYSNNKGYNDFKDGYIQLYENHSDSVSIITGGIQTYWKYENLPKMLSNINTYRKNRDLSVLVLFAFWGLNVVDANVDGHFFNFDIDDDLSLSLSPKSWAITGNKQAFGLNLILNMY